MCLYLRRFGDCRKVTWKPLKRGLQGDLHTVSQLPLKGDCSGGLKVDQIGTFS